MKCEICDSLLSIIEKEYSKKEKDKIEHNELIMVGIAICPKCFPEEAPLLSSVSDGFKVACKAYFPQKLKSINYEE